MVNCRFVIFASQRSGSNYLQSLLDSHPRIFCSGEVIIQPSHLENRLKDLAVSSENISVLIALLRRRKYTAFIDAFYSLASELDVDAIGFRFFHEHLGFFRRRPVLGYLSSGDIRIVHLKRRNLLRKYLSLLVARSSDLWTSLESSDMPSVHMNARECRRYFLESEKESQYFDTYLRQSNSYSIYYEDLISDAGTQLERLQQFLDVSPQFLTSGYKKTGTRTLCDSISNYDQLRVSFRGTRWEEFFESEG